MTTLLLNLFEPLLVCWLFIINPFYIPVHKKKNNLRAGLRVTTDSHERQRVTPFSNYYVKGKTHRVLTSTLPFLYSQKLCHAPIVNPNVLKAGFADDLITHETENLKSLLYFNQIKSWQELQLSTWLSSSALPTAQIVFEKLAIAPKFSCFKSNNEKHNWVVRKADSIIFYQLFHI